MTNNEKNQRKITKKDIFRLIGYALQFPSHLALGLIFLIVAIGFELLAPFAVRKIFDTELKQTIINQKAILGWLALYFVANLLGVLLQYISGIQLQIMAMKVIKKMRMQIFENIQRIGISFFDNMPAGSIVSKITNDTGAVQALYVKVLGKIVTSLLYIVGIYAALFTIQPMLGWMLLIIVPSLYMVFSLYLRKANRHNSIIRSKLSQLNGELTETVQGIRIIQAFNAQKKVEEHYDKTARERYEERMKMLRLNVTSSYNMVGAFQNIVFMIMIYYFGNQVVKNSAVTTTGMLYIYVDYVALLFTHIRVVMEQMNDLSRSSAASTQVFEMIDKEGKDTSSERLPQIEGNVEFSDVSFFYKEDEYVLKNINLKADKGQTIALVGHTGSGKSSIMNLLLKFYSPQHGKITVDKMDLADLPEQAIRDQMGIVLQEPYLFTGTVLSNITLGKPNVSREMAERALQMVGGDVVTRNLKDGIDEKVVERGATLSSGQRQLISFARALAQDPRILILDEATSSVDSETEQIIQSAMNVLMQGRTTFVIAHRLSTIRNADRIYLLEKGRVIEQGNHEELIAQKGKYYEMYQTQNSAQVTAG